MQAIHLWAEQQAYPTLPSQLREVIDALAQRLHILDSHTFALEICAGSVEEPLSAEQVEVYLQHADVLVQFIPAGDTTNLTWPVPMVRCYSRILPTVEVTVSLLAMLLPPMVDQSLLSPLLTALHEVLCNAFLHGNAGLVSDYTTMEEMEQFQQLVTEHLQRPACYCQPVTLSLTQDEDGMVWLRVSDQGRGFMLGRQTEISGISMHGQGLAIARQLMDDVRCEDEGRTIALHHRRLQDAYRRLHQRGNNCLTFGYLQRTRILVVDDHEFNRLLITRILAERGFQHIRYATNGQEALDITREWQPDIVYLDLVMPIMDGYAYCRQARMLEASADIPIIVQTAMDSPKERAEAFSAGATDLIIKPIHGEELILRTLVHLEKRFLLEEMRSYYRRMERELQASREMQLALLPSANHLTALGAHYGLSIASAFHPSHSLGGDIWGVREISEDTLAFYMADFSGHDVSAALNTFRLHAMIQNLPDADQPALFLERLNRELVGFLPIGQFATCFYMVFDRQQQQLTYSAAGSPPPFISRKEQGEWLDSTGFVLGHQVDASFASHTVSLGAGESVFLYSDALIETASYQGDFLEEGYWLQMVHPLAGQPAKQIIAQVETAYRSHCGDYQRDDLTLLCISVNA